MTAKRLAKRKKSLAPKISLAKLSNKKLNKLARQGKLKKSNFGKKKLVSLIEERTNKLPKAQADGSHIEREREDPDEIPLEEADYEYFAKAGRDFSFLKELAKSGKSKKRRFADDGGFAAVEGRHAEKRGKLVESRTETKHLLPVKSKEKGIVAREITVESKNDDQHEVEQNANELPQPDSTVETFAERQLDLDESKQIIALLCTSIIEAPEENINKLKDLRMLLGDVDGTVPVNVRKLALLSLLEVFKDIIPSYRIRILTQTEKKQSMKKETKKLQQFEESLLNNYRHYLETLESLLTGKPVARKEKKKKNIPSKVQGLTLSEADSLSLSEIALKCLCGALNAHSHFNYRTNIISLIVRYINHKNPKFSDTVCDCVRRLFAEDKAGDATLEVVRLIGRVIKVRNFEVQPKVLRTFLSLKIKEIEKPEIANERKKKKSREQRFKETSRKDRKREKRFAYLEKELVDAAVKDHTKKRLRLHTEIINVVFLTYFRILKHARRSVLLSAVLEGLAKFAHLINVSFFDDLFSVITELVDTGDLSYRESLHSIQTALTLLLGHGAAFNIDPQRFYTHLYRTLFQLHAGSDDEDVSVALRCLDIVINKRRGQASQQRILAYAKRLSTLSLQMNNNGALAVLTLIKNILQDHRKSDVMLETESHGSGVFQPELDDPEHSCAHNTALFELHLLMKSFDPSVRQYSKHVLETGTDRQKPLPVDLARKDAMELFKKYNPDQIVLNERTTPRKKQRVRSWQKFSQQDLQNDYERCSLIVDNINIAELNFR